MKKINLAHSNTLIKRNGTHVFGPRWETDETYTALNFGTGIKL